MKEPAVILDLMQKMIHESMAFNTLCATGHEGTFSETSWGVVVRVDGTPVSIQHGVYFNTKIPAEVAAFTDPDRLTPWLRLTAYKIAAEIDAYIRKEIRARSTASTLLDSVPAAIAAAEAPVDAFRALVPILEADEDDPRLEPFHVLPSFDQDEEIIILAPGNIAFAGEIVRMEAYQANRKEVGIKGLYMCGATVQRPDLIWRVPLTVDRRIP